MPMSNPTLSDKHLHQYTQRIHTFWKQSPFYFEVQLETTGFPFRHLKVDLNVMVVDMERYSDIYKVKPLKKLKSRDIPLSTTRPLSLNDYL